MMNNLDLAQTGELIRKIRKERGLRLKHLATKTSPRPPSATLSGDSPCPRG